MEPTAPGESSAAAHRDGVIVAFAYRDAAEQREHRSQDIGATPIHPFTLERVRAVPVTEAAEQALGRRGWNG
jgi:hypothetical protein